MADTIGGRIKELRKKRKVEYGHCTQKDLGNEMGVTEEQIRKWENDEININSEKIVKLSRYFNVSCDVLLHGGSTEHLVLINKTGLSDDTISILEKCYEQNTVISEMFDTLAQNIPFLIALYEYIFGKFEEDKTPEKPDDVFSCSMERYALLYVIGAIENMRKEVQRNGKS